MVNVIQAGGLGLAVLVAGGTGYCIGGNRAGTSDLTVVADQAGQVKAIYTHNANGRQAWAAGTDGSFQRADSYFSQGVEKVRAPDGKEYIIRSYVENPKP